MAQEGLEGEQGGLFCSSKFLDVAGAFSRPGQQTCDLSPLLDAATERGVMKSS